MTRRPATIAEVQQAGGYGVIYADPAWAYTQGGRGSTEDKYEGMPLDEIQALPVSRICSPDGAVLFLWCTWPFLVEGLATMKAWGFEYKTNAFVWIKYHEGSGKRCVGGGFWSRANTEYCLLGVRGKGYPRRLEERAARGVRQLIETEEPEVLLAPRMEHSTKPVEARDRIVTMLGSEVPKIELFARERFAGWDSWGDDPKLGIVDVDLGER